MKPINISLDNLDPEQDLQINKFDINESLSNYPFNLTKYGIAHDNAVRSYEGLRDLHKELRSQVWAEIKSTRSKISDKSTEIEVDIDERVIKARKDMNKAKWDLDTVKTVLEGMRSKKDTMITLSSNMRAEIK